VCVCWTSAVLDIDTVRSRGSWVYGHLSAVHRVGLPMTRSGPMLDCR